METRNGYPDWGISKTLGVLLAAACLCPQETMANKHSTILAKNSINYASKNYLEKTISGKIVDENNHALPGVSIIVKGTQVGTSSSADGSFSLNVADNAQTLTFSFIGYTSQDVIIGNQTTLNVILLPSNEELNEVIVVGYGTQSAATVTGAVSNIQAKDLVRTPSIGTSDALVGRVQGITARKADARPGNSTSIQIRNMGTPLYVIDGIPSDADNFNNLGQNDIESISILKDASAAIYGLRAANGVILVTTKRGKAGDGPAKINLSGYYGLQNFTRYPKPANAYQHMRGLVESDVNQGRTPSITPEELAKWKTGTEKGYQSFDYYKMVMRPNVPQYYGSANVSGGTEKISYYLSFGHLNQDALIKDYNFKRSNIQANLESRVTKRLKIGSQISARLEKRFQVGVPGLDDYFNPFLSIFTMWPTERPYANDNPKYINQTHNVNVNPATYKKDITGYIDELTRVVKGNFYAEYDFDFGLKAKGTYSYGFTNFDFDGFEYTYDAYKYNAEKDTYDVVVGGGNQNPWRERRKRNVVDRFAQFQLSYSKQLGNHDIAAVAAYEQSDNVNNYMIVHTVPPNNYIPLMSFANQDYLLDEWKTEARAGYIGRVNYAFKQKYLVEAVGRYDGSFLYAPGKRFGFFPGVSAGWRISEEDFFKGKLENVFSNLKIRASYGRTGSDRLANDNFIVDPFSYLSGYNFMQGSAIFDGTYNIGVRPRGLPITTLSWITNVSSNIGIDFGFIGGKLTGQVDLFQRKREGLPAARYDVLLPSEVGYTLPNENLNSDVNKGIEAVLTYKSSVGQVDYTFSANATLSRRKDLDFYKPRFGNSYNEYRDSYVDRWGNINWGYQVEGQFQSQQEIENHTIDNDGQGNRTQLPGDFIYKDVNGDGIINNLDERPIGFAEGANPYMSFAFNGSLAYKGFSLFFDFAGASLQSFQRNWELKIPYQNNGTSPHFMLEDRWHREDPYDPNSQWIAGTYPALRKDNTSHVNFRKSDFWITNVRYIRLRNIELGYSFDQKLSKKIGLSALRVYVNATNLFSIDNVKKYEIDPEISSGNALVYPQQRLLNIGFNLTF